MDNNRYIIGIDIGGTYIRIGLISEDIKLSNFIIEKSKELLEENPIDNLYRFIRTYIDNNAQNKNIIGIVIGFPSTIDKDRKVVLSTPNIKGLNELKIVEELSKLLDIKVYIDKDVNLLLQYDIYENNFDSNGTIIGFYIGTGLGNSIQINGKILTGRNGAAGELGHIPLINDQKKCSCGNEGCIENYASGKHLQELRELYFKETELEDIFSIHRNDKIISRFIEYISIAIATEINIFDPDYIILGGGVLQMKDFPFKVLDDYIYKHSRKPFPANNLKYHYSINNQENGVIGAGIYGFRCVKEEKI